MPVKAQQVMNKLGLEATEEIVWQGWQPGGEYTKSITLKNVDIKTKKLKYRCVLAHKIVSYILLKGLITERASAKFLLLNFILDFFSEAKKHIV